MARDQRSVRWPPELARRIDYAGKEEYRNFSQIVIMAVTEWLNAHYPEADDAPEIPKPPEPEYVIPERKKPGPPRPQPSVGLEEEKSPDPHPSRTPVDPYAPYDLPKIAPRRRF